MNIRCPSLKCSTAPNLSPGKRPFIRNGAFFRKSDSRWIQRYRCQTCGKQFSNATFHCTYFQKQRRITLPLYLMMNSHVTQRRAARTLKVNVKTVVRRYRFLAAQGRLEHQEWMNKTYADPRLKRIQFDDLETSEHTKCKPLSVCLAVEPGTRKILGFQVSAMPAKGLLAKKAVKKYGYRRDERPRGWIKLMRGMQPFVTPDATWQSDQNPHYPKYLKKYHPQAIHETTLGGRGSSSGQGELKKLGNDPLFSLNHTCAMLRANLSRLIRKTWANTKNQRGLVDHLWIYINYHNQVLTQAPAPETQS